jgi:hypothetical protein
VEIARRFAWALLLLAAAATAQTAAPEAPRAASSEEWKAYQTAAALTDPAALEASATDFAQKFPASTLRAFLFQRAMGLYERNHNPGKTLEMARTVLKYDPENPLALLTAAQMLANGARDTDLDRNARLDEARADALSALEHMGKLSDPGGMSAERFGELSTQLRGAAHEVLGTVAFKQHDYAAALREYHVAAAAQEENADPVLWLRMSVSCEKTGNLDMSSQYAGKAISASVAGTRIRELAEQQKDRVARKLADQSSGANSAAPAPATPPSQSVRF